MRLLNLWSHELKEFERDVPRYYILSHRWGEKEVSTKDFVKRRDRDSVGYLKVLSACEFAKYYKPSDPKWIPLEVNWIWIDTVCIDKRSSAELSEAVNSMYTWYGSAVACFAHLADVSKSASYESVPLQQMKESSWFTRGWTLQELLAPERVVFCDTNWEIVGQISSPQVDPVTDLAKIVSEITCIPERHLRRFQRDTVAIAQVMSWSSRRNTTRREDEAYCLLGLFNVNMPLLYGEGRKAFQRLQEEIIKKSTDMSIFAWKRATDPWAKHGLVYGMLAAHPRWFQYSGDIVYAGHHEADTTRHYTMTNNGLELNVGLLRPSPRGTAGSYQFWGADSFQSLQNIRFLKLNCKRLTGTQMSSLDSMSKHEWQKIQYVKICLKPTSPTFLQTEIQGSEPVSYDRILPKDFGESTQDAPFQTLERRQIYVSTFPYAAGF